jgi:Molybdopterin biosynthesis enzyme
MNAAYILPTGDEICNGTVLDLDSQEIMGQIVRQYPMAEVTRLAPLVDEEEAICKKVEEIAARAPDIIILVGGSGGGHRHSRTLGKDFTHSALSRFLDQNVSREIYGKNGHLWCKIVCGKKDGTLVVNVPGPFQEAKAAMASCLRALAAQADLDGICRSMADAVYAQYPPGGHHGA